MDLSRQKRAWSMTLVVNATQLQAGQRGLLAERKPPDVCGKLSHGISCWQQGYQCRTLASDICRPIRGGQQGWFCGHISGSFGGGFGGGQPRGFACSEHQCLPCRQCSRVAGGQPAGLSPGGWRVVGLSITGTILVTAL